MGATHDYSPEQALQLLLRKLRAYDVQLAQQIQSAIDAGKDVKEEDLTTRGRKSRVYRKTVRFTDEEALHVAVSALQSCFVEQALFVNSADKNFRPAALRAVSRDGVGSEKVVEIEIQTETQISREDQPTLRLSPISEDEVEQQKRNVTHLYALATFDSE